MPNDREPPVRGINLCDRAGGVAEERRAEMKRLVIVAAVERAGRERSQLREVRIQIDVP